MPQQKSQKDVIIINGMAIPIDTPPDVVKQILLDPAKLQTLAGNGRAPQVPIDLGPDISAANALRQRTDETMLGGSGAKIGADPAGPWQDDLERMRKVGMGTGRAIQVGGQLPVLPLPLRLAMAGLGGAVTGGAANIGGSAEDITTGAAKEGMVGAGLQALLGGIMGEGIPKMSYKAGMKLGGIKGDLDQATGAYMRERERGGVIPGMGVGISLGNAGKTGRRIAGANAELQAAEEAIPGQASLGKAFRGSTQRDVPKALQGEDPLEAIRGTKAAEETFLKSQTIARKVPRHMLEDSSSRQIEGLQRLRPNKMSQDSVGLSARDLGNLKRDLFKTNEAQSIFNKVLNKEYVPSSVSSAGKAHLSLANSADKAQEGLDMLANSGQSTLGPLNSRLSDLFTIKEVNDTLRGGGGVLADVGQVGMRGGLGAGLAKNIAAASGTQGGMFERLGGAMGLFGLAPRVMSYGGSAAGRAAEMAAPMQDLYSPFNRTDLVDIIKALREPTASDPRFSGPPKKKLAGVSFRGKE